MRVTEKSAQQKLKSRIKDLEDAIKRAIQDKEALCVELNQLKNSKEILDVDAPRCGLKWTQFEKENLDEHFQDFLLMTAKKLGRSTASIRFKVMECIMAKLSPEHKDNMKSMIIQILS